MSTYRNRESRVREIWYLKEKSAQEVGAYLYLNLEYNLFIPKLSILCISTLQNA